MIAVPGLMLINLLMIWGLDKSLFGKQVLFWIIGGGVYFLSKKIGREAFFKWSKYLYIGLLIFLGLPLIFGQVVRGSVRWISIAGFTFQPSELAKPIIIGWFASFLTREGIGNLTEFILDLILISIPCGLILFQPDLGSSAVIFLSLMIILFIRKPKLSWWIPLIVLVIIFTAVSWNKILEPYQIDRLTGFINPTADPLGKGYNQIQSKIAIGAGGLFGRGFGLGRQTQLAFLPEKQTDFILAAVGEELGFVGILFTLGFYFYLFWWMIKKIKQTNSTFDFNYRLGIFILLFLQTSFNLAMNLQLFPVVGLPLPLLSYGGSSLISTLLALGLF